MCRRRAGLSVAARWGPGLAVVEVGVALAIISVTTVNSILPDLRRDLGATTSDLQWIVSGYLLAYGLAMVVTGRLGDVWGRRPTFLTGIAVFTTASIVAATAPDAQVLLVARLVQGFGAGFINPQATALIRDLVPGPSRARVFGWYEAVAGAAIAAGPFVGGVLAELGGSPSGWRWVFWVNVPIGLLVIAGGARLPEPTPATGAGRADVVGVALLWAGLAALLVPVFELTDLPVGAVVASLAGAVALLAVFTVWERGVRRRGGVDPVVDLGLFRKRAYRTGAVLNVAYMAGYTALFYVLTLYLRSGVGLSQVQAGAMQLPVALGAAVAAPVVGRRGAGRPRVVQLVGVALMVAGALLAWGLAEALGDQIATLLWSLVVPLIGVGVGGSLVMTMNLALMNAAMPADEAGSANAVRQTSARIGATVGTSTVGAVLAAVLGTAGAASTVRADWDRALSAGMAMSAGFLALMLVPVGVDLVGFMRERRRPRM